MGEHGAQADARCSAVYSEHNGLLPLQKALKKIRSHKNLIQWSCGDSIFKLITILCLPIMKEALESTRSVAQNTEEIKNVIRLHAKDGKLIELAVLLMVAREKAMEPITFEGVENFNSGGCMTLRECVIIELAAQIHYEYKFMGKSEERKLAQNHKELKEAMVSTLQLLEIFERAGDAISAYLQLERTNASKEQVAQEVTAILGDAGFTLNSEDTDLCDIVDCDPVQDEKGESEEPTKCGSECQDVGVPYSQQEDSFSKNQKPINHVPDKLSFPGARNYGTLRGQSAVSTSGFQPLNARFHSEARLCSRAPGKGHHVGSLPSTKRLANCMSLVKRGLKWL